jgi:hypothetical protein
MEAADPASDRRPRRSGTGPDLPDAAGKIGTILLVRPDWTSGDLTRRAISCLVLIRAALRKVRDRWPAELR